MSASLAAFGMDLPCRSICPLFTNTSTTQVSSLLSPATAGGSSQDVHRFLLGTSSFAGGNKIYFVEYAAVAEEKSGAGGNRRSAIARSAAVWQVDSEVSDISCCPNNSLENTLFATTAAPSLGRPNSSAGGCSIFSIADIYVSTPARIASLPSSTRRLCWDPQGLTTEVRAIDGATIVSYKLAQLSATAPAPPPSSCIRLGSGATGEEDVRQVHHVAWSPHHEHVVAAAVDNRIVIGDMRTSQSQAQAILAGSVSAHGFGAILHVEFSPSSTSTMMSSGEDGFVRLWDSRKLNAAASGSAARASGTQQQQSSAMLSGQKVHDHWCTKATFNSFHEELVLTSSTDNTCRLWNLPAAASGSVGPGTDPKSLSRRLSAQLSSQKDPGAFLLTSPSIANFSISPSSAFARHNRSQSNNHAGVSEGCIVTLSEFGDSVTSCCWSQANDSPWVFAAVSANGKMLVDAVPDEQIQRILLESTSE